MKIPFLAITLLLSLWTANALAQEAAPKRTQVELLATGQGVHIERARVEQAAADQLEKLSLERKRFEAEYRKKKQEIIESKMEELVGDRLLELESMARQISKEQLVKEVTSDVAEPTEEEIDQLWEANKGRLKDRTREQMAPQIGAYLRNQKSQAALVSFVEGLADKYEVKYHLDPVRFEIATAEFPAKGGPESAPVKLVEFSEFECPYCARINPILVQVMERFGDQVRLIFRHFPLQMHRHARKAAEASMCAHDQGKFWEMHDALFADRNALEVDRMKETAAGLGLDAEAFSQCLDSGEKAPLVDRDLEDGLLAGVNGTPSLFINGRPLPAGASFESIVEIIEEELQKAQ